jgi:hypothetical protein
MRRNAGFIGTGQMGTPSRGMNAACIDGRQRARLSCRAKVFVLQIDTPAKL